MIHEFRADRYFNTFGSHPPVLRVADGDTIVTGTLDCTGVDCDEKYAAGGGNPLTGPFFVEGAEPGDTLEVHLLEVLPNRKNAHFLTVIAPHLLVPGSASLLKNEERVKCPLDMVNKKAEIPLSESKQLAMPLQPMLGCLGVAAERGQAIGSDTSGRHGGNMDYKGIAAGARVQFPVFAPGGLLFVGDGHAWQADGEILGTGLEVSMDVRFSVRVLKGKRIGWPRIENETHIVALGNARPLEEALQYATTEMLAWLGEYGLSLAEAHRLLGTVVEYEIANAFDPAYTIACKVGRKYLSVRE